MYILGGGGEGVACCSQAARACAAAAAVAAAVTGGLAGPRAGGDRRCPGAAGAVPGPPRPATC